MENPTFIGLHTRYSSWTARVEVLLQYFDIPHNAKMYNVFNAAAEQPPAPFKGGLFPSLQPRASSDPEFIIRDSLAICEYLAEANPQLELWPKDEKLRALAPSAASQMHSGFSELRNSFSTNFLAHYTGDIPRSPAALKECRKMVDLWSSIRAVTKQRLGELGQSDGGFLFGKFSVADAFFWPVLWRFRSYGLPLEGITDDGLKWMSTMWNDEKLRGSQASYFVQAKEPLTAMPNYDALFKDVPGVQTGRFSEDWVFKP